MLRHLLDSEEIVNSSPRSNSRSISSRFQNDLKTLMQELEESSSHFIRCIKPNSTKSPGNFHDEIVMLQLARVGVLETVKMRKLGFPYRYNYHQFVGRFRGLVPNFPWDTSQPASQTCQQLLNALDISPEDYRLGQTKIFFKMVAQLEAGRKRRASLSAVKIQRNYRRWSVERSQKAQLQATIQLQSSFRVWIETRNFQKMRKSATTLQSAIRGKFASENFQKIQQNFKLKIIQSAIRGFLARKQIQDIIRALQEAERIKKKLREEEAKKSSIASK